jgi:acetate kinase
MRDALVATFNAGSSSLRCGVYRTSEAGPQAAFLISIRGLPHRMILQIVDHDAGTSKETELGAPGDAPHETAFSTLMAHLQDRVEMTTVTAFSHRVVHGGQDFAAPVRVTPEILDQLDALSALAPSHQPHNLRPIRTLLDRHPDVPQIACFDTAFHRGQPPLAQLYALPRELTEEGILRFGFHGLSYDHIAQRLQQDHPHLFEGRVIVAHLGHGVSLCALDKGQSVATTMGLTALDGMPMGQRCGALDPGVVLHLILDKGYAAEEVRDILYERSGLLGVSGLSGEMSDLLASDVADAAEAVSLFVHRFRREVGSLTAALGGLDGLVLTGGMGAHLPVLRERLCRSVEWQGARFDAAANERDGPLISTGQSGFEILMLPTDEERVLAQAAVGKL